jgi:hypothetical protein
MKQLSVLFLSALTLTLRVNGQDPTPNAGFEDWTTITFPTQYEVPNDWDQLNDQTNFIGILTCVKTTDAHTGSFAAKLVTKVVTILTLVDTANGIISTGELITTPPYGITGGIPYMQRPDSMAGWIKYTPVGGDSCQIVFVLRNSNNDTIGKAQYKTGEITQYTRFSAPIVYNTGDLPDTSLWLISSSNGFKAIPNSTLYVDDLSLILPVGIQEINAEEIVMLEANLVTDQLTVKNVMGSPLDFRMYNTKGELVKAINITAAQQQISIAELPGGIYFYRAQNNQASLAGNGKIVIQR